MSEIIQMENNESLFLKCRICLTGKNNLKIIFNAYLDSFDYNNILYYCTGVKIEVKNSYLPECGICEDCEDSLIKFYTFKKNFISSEKNFKKISKSISDETNNKIGFKRKAKKEENKNMIYKILKIEEVNLNELSEIEEDKHFNNFSIENEGDLAEDTILNHEVLNIQETNDNDLSVDNNLKHQIIEEYSEVNGIEVTKAKSIRIKEKLNSCSNRSEVCSVCAKNIVRRNMNKHMQTHKNYTNETKPHLCNQCGTRFTYKDSLIKHMRVHNNDKRFACSFCGEKFLYWGSRRSHIDRFHTGCRRFTCHLCEQKFFQNSNLITHIRRFHSNERPHECTQCEKKFISKHMLNNHIITHTKEKKHLCEICSKGFGMKKSLKIHLKTHFNQRDYVCSECPRTFTQAHVLRTHMKTHPNFIIPPPGTVLNQSALKRREISSQVKIKNEDIQPANE